MFLWACTTKFWQACRNTVGKNTKNNRKNQKRWVFFLNKFVFFSHQKWFFSNGECNFDNASKIFLKISTDLQLRFRKRRKKLRNFWKEKISIKMFLCTVRIQFWHSCQKFLVKSLKTICSKYRNDEKHVRFPKRTISHQNIRLNMRKEVMANLPWLCCQEYENFPKLKKCWSYNFLNKITFFYQKRFFSNRECTFYNHTKKLSSEKHRFAAQIPKTTEKITNFLKEKYISSKCSYVYVEFSCDNPAEKFSSKLWKFFAGIPERMKKWKTFRKAISPQNLRLNMYKEILTSLP